jgi:transcriptional regulator with XRE-family HTH domain
LREWRESAGLSTRDLAREMGTNVAWVNRSERGHRRVDAVEFLAWLRACGVSLPQAARALERAER